jgi:hypothetical protein
MRVIAYHRCTASNAIINQSLPHQPRHVPATQLDPDAHWFTHEPAHPLEVTPHCPPMATEGLLWHVGCSGKQVQCSKQVSSVAAAATTTLGRSRALRNTASAPFCHFEFYIVHVIHTSQTHKAPCAESEACTSCCFQQYYHDSVVTFRW